MLWQAQRGVHAAVLAEPQFKAVLVDAAGTLIRPSEPAAEVGASHSNACLHKAVCRAKRLLPARNTNLFVWLMDWLVHAVLRHLPADTLRRCNHIPVSPSQDAMLNMLHILKAGALAGTLQELKEKTFPHAPLPNSSRLQVYLKYASKHGCLLSAAEVLANYRRAFAAPWDKSASRYVADGRDFWRFVVSQSTLVDDEACFEAIYAHYARAEAWLVAPGAHAALASLRSAGAARCLLKCVINHMSHSLSLRDTVKPTVA